jgi:hypothetical protein
MLEEITALILRVGEYLKTITECPIPEDDGRIIACTRL